MLSTGRELLQAIAPDGTKLVFTRLIDDSWILTGNGHTVASGPAGYRSVQDGVAKFSRLSEAGRSAPATDTMPARRISYDIFG